MEEEILSRATGFAADEVLRLPPRLPGHGLHQSLLDTARAQDEAARRAERREARTRARREQAEAAAADATAAAEGATAALDSGRKGGKATAGGSASRPSTGGGKLPSRASAASHPQTAIENDTERGAEDDDLSENEGDGDGNTCDGGTGPDGSECNSAAAALAAAAAYGDEYWLEPVTATAGGEGAASAGEDGAATPAWDRVPTAREEGGAHDVIVTGPPLSGKSTLSRALGATYRTPTLTMDGVIKEALRLRNKLGARVRAALHWFTAKEEVRRMLKAGVNCPDASIVCA